MKNLSLILILTAAFTTTAIALAPALPNADVLHEPGEPASVADIAPSLAQPRTVTLACEPVVLHVVIANAGDEDRIAGAFWSVGIPPKSHETFYLGPTAYEDAVAGAALDGGQLIEGPHDSAEITPAWALSVLPCAL